MRITANIPDNIGRVVKTFADNEKKSVSSVITDAVQNYVLLEKGKWNESFRSYRQGACFQRHS